MSMFSHSPYINRHARRTDPSTSHGAVPPDISKRCSEILRLCFAGGRMLTSWGVEQIMHHDVHQRCSDLWEAGFITTIKDPRTGDDLTGLSRYNKPALYFKITQRGLDHLKSLGNK